jgi:hypothetical protein
MDISGFLRNLLYEHYANKYIEPIKNSMPHKRALLTTLELEPNESSKVIKKLTSADGFQGQAASTLQEVDYNLLKYKQDLHDRMSNTLDADQKLLDRIDEIINNTVHYLSSGGDGMLMSAAVAIDGAAVGEGGLDVPVDLLAVVASGVFAAAAGGAITAASWDIFDAMQTWVNAHQQIGLVGNYAIDLPTITVVPMTRQAIPSGVQLPHWEKWDKASPGEKAAIEAAFGDLIKAGVSPDLILYLVNMYSSMSLAKIAAMLRCLLSKGYLDPSSQMPRRNRFYDQAVSKIQSAWNTVSQHLTPNDLEGAWKDVHNVISNANHIDEVQNGVNALYNLITMLEQHLDNDSNLSASLRQIYQTMIDACQNMIDYVNDNVFDGPVPTDWPTEGFGPFISQVLQESGCKNATP